MPKVGMEPIRKQQVIDATMQCIHSDGISKASLQRIAHHAGITSGLILHYFDDKESLLEAVYRDLYKRLRNETLFRLKNAETPIDRLLAILEAQVSQEMVEPKTVTTWFAICAKISETPVLARMERVNAKRLASNLIFTLKSIGLSKVEAQDVTDELLTLIYGLWLNLAKGSILTPEQAREILFRYLKVRVPQLQE